MRRVIELSRYVVVLPAIGSIIGALVLMVIGMWEILKAVRDLVTLNVDLKQAVVEVLSAVDALLLSTVLLVIGYGLYSLFVDDKISLPAWLELNSLDDLKGRLIGVVVTIIGVAFLGILVDSQNLDQVMPVGLGAGALVAALAAFMYASHK